MKIGIITQPLQNNYGGLLQNYALQQALIRIGHNPITIDQERYHLTFSYHVKSNLKEFLKNLLRPLFHRKKRISRYEFLQLNSRVSKNAQYFIDKYLIHTNRVWSSDETRKLAESLCLDALIVGSDQVWRPRSKGRLMANFLDFATEMDVLRLAYAASFGLDTWKLNAEQTQTAKHYIQYFDAISVREKSGIELCKEYLGVDAIHVLDPTMLLDAEDYRTIIRSESTPTSKGNMFCYILDPNSEKEKLIRKYEEQKGLKSFELMPHERIGWHGKNTDEAFNYAHVASWLRAFDDSDYVICDSFHGAVFSIIFNKPFTVIQNEKRGNTRFDSLLGMFNLYSRLVSTKDFLENEKAMSNEIDWSEVNRIRNVWRKKSLDFLIENLKDKRNGK